MYLEARDRALSGEGEELGINDNLANSNEKIPKPGYLRMQRGCSSVTKGLCYLTVGAIVAKSIAELLVIGLFPWSLSN
jgi:hypothetical protein